MTQPHRGAEAAPPEQEAIPRAAALPLATFGGMLGAILASSCCIAPLLLFSLGVSGAWIAKLTALAPYQPYFIAVSFACLAYGYLLVYRQRRTACAAGGACARPLPGRIVTMGLVLATLLMATAAGLDLIGPHLF
ncbi:MAG: mercury transporter MerT [Methylocapsa sp.]|nr:mercury transporter MerT [Methylocapsa sp.]